MGSLLNTSRMYLVATVPPQASVIGVAATFWSSSRRESSAASSPHAGFPPVAAARADHSRLGQHALVRDRTCWRSCVCTRQGGDLVEV